MFPFKPKADSTVKESAKSMILLDKAVGLIAPLTEKLKGKIEEESRFSPSQVSEHFEDYKENELLFKNVPIIAGVIDKLVDFAVGPGYYIEGEDKEAVEAINNFMEKHNFDLLLREIIRNMLIYGNAYVEKAIEKEIDVETGDFENFTISALKNWDPKNIYVSRSEQGEVRKFVQQESRRANKVEFEPDEMAHFKFNVVADEPYGTSLIHPLKTITYDKLKLERDMALLMNRKANSPLQVKIGGVRLDKYIQPSAAQLSQFGAELEHLRARNEFVTNDLVEMKVVEMGRIGEKFLNVFNHYDGQIIFGSQVPEVLLGKGSIPEGLAKVQMDAFQLRIQSIQLNVELVLEEQIIKPYLTMLGLNDDIDFEWGPQEEEDKEKLLETYSKLLSPALVLTQQTRTDFENQLRQLMGIPGNVEVTGEPLVTPVRKPFGKGFEAFNPIPLAREGTIEYDVIESFVGFKITNFMNNIKKFIKGRRFEDVRSLRKKDIPKFKKALSSGFEEGKTISTITKDVEPFMKKKEETDNVVRTEVIRASNEGALQTYKESPVVRQVEWSTSMDLRVCPVCAGLNNKRFTFEKAEGKIPIHPRCRCSWLPITE